MQNHLTPHPEGSVRELWSLSLPLMVSTLATLFMIFTDRIFLAHYSIEALNASVNAGTFAWALMAGVGMIASMSEVFVAQYNGAGRFKNIAKPVWQMVWFSVFSIPLFLFFAFWGGPLIFGADRYASLEIEYFRTLMIFSPSYALMMAFSGFFIGRGKAKIMIWIAVIANLINICLDWALIFGIPGWIPEMGIQGAALATCFGYSFEAIVLGALFLKKENRETFQTSSWKIDLPEMKKCLKVGTPQGVFYSLEIVGWAIFYWMMTGVGEKHITISSICQSFIILLSFFSDGLSRGAAAVAGNLIGAKKQALLKKVFKSGVILVCSFSFLTSLIFLLGPIDTVLFLFTQDLDPSLHTSLQLCMIFAFVHIFFEGLRWLFSGLLIAAGDSLFLLISGVISVWGFLLAPIYYFVVKNSLSIEYAWATTVIYSALFFFVYWARFKWGSWQQIDLLNQQAAVDLSDSRPKGKLDHDFPPKDL